MFWFGDLEACEILAPQPEIKPTLPALEGKVLTPGLPGKSLIAFLIRHSFHNDIWRISEGDQWDSNFEWI